MRNWLNGPRDNIIHLNLLLYRLNTLIRADGFWHPCQPLFISELSHSQAVKVSNNTTLACIRLTNRLFTGVKKPTGLNYIYYIFNK